MNTFDINKTINMKRKVTPETKKGPGRYTRMYNEIQEVLDVSTFGSSLIMTIGAKNNNFLFNHRLTLDSERPRYTFYTQYKKDNLRLNSTWVMQPGVKAFAQYSPTKNFTQELTSIMTATEHGPFRCLVSRSVYEDEDSCLEAVLDTQSGAAVYYNQAMSNKLSVGVEGYYDFLSNKDIHLGVSACYEDVCRKCIVTATSHYSLYLNYLRKVNKNVMLAAGCNIMSMNKPAEMYSSALVGCSFKLPKTKTEFQSTIDMYGNAKVLLREKLSSNAKISFSGEFNPFYDKYSFGISFTYGIPVDKNLGYTPLSGSQS